jgi:hypothetical protein
MGRAPGMERRAATHCMSPSMVRRRKWVQAAAFIGGEGCAVVADGP